MATVHNYVEAGYRFTETSFDWVHRDGVKDPNSVLVVFVGAVDSQNLQALRATFSGSVEQEMTLAHEVTGAGISYPSHHIFTLADPSFSGSVPSGTIEVTFQDTATTFNAVSVVVTGVNTGLGIDGLGNFVSAVDHHLTSVGEVSGTVSAASGSLVIDCVTANAGLPDSHTPGEGQELIIRAPLSKTESAAMSISAKLAINTGETGMTRTQVTSLQSVTSTAMHIYGN